MSIYGLATFVWDLGGQQEMSCGKTIREVHEEKQWTTTCCRRVRIFVVYVTLVSIGRLYMHSQIKSQRKKKPSGKTLWGCKMLTTKAWIWACCFSVCSVCQSLSYTWILQQSMATSLETCPEILEFAPARRTVGNLNELFHKSLAVSGMVPLY